MCSQFDVDLDPYAKRNPELAKCPRVGATYWVNETIQVKESHSCGSLPGPDAGWQVQEIGSDKWRVSISGSAWDLTKLEGESKGQKIDAKIVQVHIRGSQYAFIIAAHQEC